LEGRRLGRESARFYEERRKISGEKNPSLNQKMG
jgi:hypothetical protein